MAAPPPRHLSFRGQPPLFDTAAFPLHASPDGTGLKTWTALDFEAPPHFPTQGV